jgi:hypothetical protein
METKACKMKLSLVVEFDPAQLPEDVRTFLEEGYDPQDGTWKMYRQWTNGHCAYSLPAVAVPVTPESIVTAVRAMQLHIAREATKHHNLLL